MPRAVNLNRWFVPPMKALGVNAVPPGAWRLEMKFDGFRAIATISGGQAELWSRNRLTLGERFPEIVEALKKLRRRTVVLDGEIVALDPQGLPSFQLLQKSGSAATRPPILYYVFDVLRVDDRSLLEEPLEKRLAELRRLLRGASRLLRFSEPFDVTPAQLLAEARAHGWEGIIAKRAGSRYEADQRSGAWLKCKVRHEQEFVIGGYTPPRGGRAHFGALLLGYYTDSGLTYAGKVGTGFSDASLATLHQRLQRERRIKCPFIQRPPEPQAVWVRPSLVGQVSFAEWTRDGLLRQGSFLGLRDDKEPTSVVREEAAAT